LEGLRKTAKELGQDNRCPCRDLNLELPEYDAGDLEKQRKNSGRITGLRAEI
jgi:hypothetical protein